MEMELIQKEKVAWMHCTMQHFKGMERSDRLMQHGEIRSTDAE